MDLISHTLTGVAVGTVASTFSTKDFKSRTAIVLTGGFGGALPDIDAISLWSKFDATFGKWFNLSHSGKEIYSAKFWYSHHAAMHSLLAPILFSLLVIGLVAFVKKYKSWAEIKAHFRSHKLYYLAFCFGFFFHLLEDMPTPASAWDGVALFFPSEKYIGGFGKIWWWNNYDIFLIIVVVIFFNLMLNTMRNSLYKIKTKAVVGIFCLGVMLSIYQMNTRPVDFSYTGHTSQYNHFEQQSKEIQKDILGDRLYETMVKVDNWIPLYF